MCICLWNLNNYLNIVKMIVVWNRATQETFLKTRLIIFRRQKYIKKRVHRNDQKKLPWAFKKVSWVALFHTTIRYILTYTLKIIYIYIHIYTRVNKGKILKEKTKTNLSWKYFSYCLYQFVFIKNLFFFQVIFLILIN